MVSIKREKEYREVLQRKNRKFIFYEFLFVLQKIKTKMANDNYYWDLETVGSGDGYFITEGYDVPIKWTKESREAKTKYTYLDGTEVLLNDGNTYIQLQSVNQTLTIE